MQTENGSLSYENPNYQLNFVHLSSVRLEDALNSNTEHFNLNSALLRHLDMNVDMLSPDMSNMVKFYWFLRENSIALDDQVGLT